MLLQIVNVFTNIIIKILYVLNIATILSNNTCKKILENIKKAKKIIEEAASKNKGVVISCIEHSNFKYKYSYKNRILISVNE